ncbi:MAG TPA: ABC transporter permease subunit [Burkholderiaceae bacterium]|nr:ABC transporter permease subunit [Burkholderiaceae bacterium]
MRTTASHPGTTWQVLASLATLLLVWHVVAAVADDRLFPTPLDVAATLLRELAQGDLAWHLSVTLMRVAVSFAIAMAGGIALGIALGRFAALDRWARPWVVVALNVPALVVVILSYAWLGLVELALLVAVAANKIPNVALTVREGARSLARDLDEVAHVYRFGAFARLRHVILPQLAPYLFASARNGLALIWKIVLVVELLGRSSGIGFQLHALFQLFDVAAIVAYSVVFIGCVVAVEALVLGPLEARSVRWRR